MPDKPDISNKELIIELLETFLTSFIVLMLIYWFVALPEIVVGPSMEPTIKASERILVEKVTKYFKNYKRGDIVVLHPPENDNTYFVKRIVGVPGDIIKIFECDVFITRDGQKFRLNEDYLSNGTCTTGGSRLREGRSIQLEENEYVVLGDNRSKSQDSRSFGVLPYDRIVGKVIFRFWPLNKVRFF